MLTDEIRLHCLNPLYVSGARSAYRSAGTVEFRFRCAVGRVLFPRSEYTPAGGAWRDRNGSLGWIWSSGCSARCG
jgi:hypothetical protein